MTAIKAYYDGTTFIPLQHYPFHRHQQVIIVADEPKKTKEYENNKSRIDNRSA